MADAGFFRGTSAAQDSRFSDKEKKMMKQMKFADSLVKKVDMPRVKLDVIKPWITRRVTEMLGAEDEVLIEFVFNQLEEKNLNPRKMQINLTGFLNGKNARVFMQELWDLLCSASANPNGIPDSFIEEKKEEIKKRNEEQARQELLIGRQLEAERQRVEHQLSCAVRQPSPVTEERRSRHRASPAPGPGGDGLRRDPSASDSARNQSSTDGHRGRQDPVTERSRRPERRAADRERTPDDVEASNRSERSHDKRRRRSRGRDSHDGERKAGSRSRRNRSRSGDVRRDRSRSGDRRRSWSRSRSPERRSRSRSAEKRSRSRSQGKRSRRKLSSSGRKSPQPRRSPRRRSSSRERRAGKRRRSPSERSVSPPEGVKKSSHQDTAEVRKSRSKAKKRRTANGEAELDGDKKKNKKKKKKKKEGKKQKKHKSRKRSGSLSKDNGPKVKKDAVADVDAGAGDGADSGEPPLWRDDIVVRETLVADSSDGASSHGEGRSSDSEDEAGTSPELRDGGSASGSPDRRGEGRPNGEGAKGARRASVSPAGRSEDRLSPREDSKQSSSSEEEDEEEMDMEALEKKLRERALRSMQRRRELKAAESPASGGGRSRRSPGSSEGE